MTLRKYFRNVNAWDKDKLLTELVAAIGQIPTIKLMPDGTLEVDVPTGVPVSLVDRIVDGHTVNTIYKPIAGVFGGDAGKIDGGGVRVGLDTQAVNKTNIVSTGGAISIGNSGIIMDGSLSSISSLANDDLGNRHKSLLRSAFAPNGGSGFEIVDYVSPAPGTANLLVNGDFSGDLNNWTIVPVGTVPYEWTIATAPDPNNTKALRVIYTGTGAGRAQLRSDSFSVTAGEVYEIGGYINAEAPLNPTECKIEWRDGGGSAFASDSIYIIARQPEFVPFVDAFEAPAGSVAATIVLFSPLDPETSSLWFDDLWVKVCEDNTIPSRLSVIGGYGILVQNTPLRIGFFSRAHYGEYAARALINTNAITQQTVYTRTIKGNSLGANGFFVAEGEVMLKTTAAANKNMNPITWDFGGTTLFTYTTGNTGTAAGRYVTVGYHLEVHNVGATNAQTATIAITERDGPAPGTTPTAANTVYLTGTMDTCAEDTTTDQPFSVFVTPSATNNELHRGYAKMDGPIYSA